MRKEDKSNIINDITEQIKQYNHFYLTDIADLNAVESTDLRKQCFKDGIKLLVVKNTLLKKALEDLDTDFQPLYGALTGNSAVMFCNTGNTAAKMIKGFRTGKRVKPLLKAAYVEESFYIGEGELDNLVNIKSKDELIGDIISLLQSPMNNVLSGLQSGGNTVHGLLKTLGER